MFNFIEKLKDYTARRDNTDMVVRSWKSKNNSIYADFNGRIDAIAHGDMSVLEQIFNLAKNCVPQEALDLYAWLGNLDKGLDIDAQLWGAGKYADIIAECLTKKQSWLSVNLKTGDVLVSADKKPNCLTICADTPMRLWKRLPVDVKSNIVSAVDNLIDGCGQLGNIGKETIYQGIAYFAQLLFLSHAAFIGEFLANLYDKVIEEKESLAYCMYYFVVFDHGLTKMAKILDGILRNESIDQNGMAMIGCCVRLLAGRSIEMGVETKASWEKVSNDCCPEIWKDVAYVMHNIKMKRGNRKTINSIDDILIRDCEKTKQGIHLFLHENHDDICLAYLLRALVKAEKIKPSVKYMTFHRAIESFVGHTLGYDVPQKRYGEIKEMSLTGMQRGKSYKKAKQLIDYWTDYFANCG